VLDTLANVPWLNVQAHGRDEATRLGFVQVRAAQRGHPLKDVVLEVVR
jgi:hypothetical protein